MATVAPEADTVLDVRNPRTGEIDFCLPVASAHEVEQLGIRVALNRLLPAPSLSQRRAQPGYAR